MCCVPKGRAIVLSGFYGEITSSHCKGEDTWGLSTLNSERLVAELGDETLPPLANQNLSILEDMIGLHINGSCKDLSKLHSKHGSYKKTTIVRVPNYTGNMV
eukprot:8255009-Ditylum_brightwellii.AAC.1